MLFHRTKSLLIIALLAGIGVFSLVIMNAQSMVIEKQDQFLLPELINQINDIKYIRIKSKKKQLMLVKQEEGWLEHARNYPVAHDKVNAFLYNLSQARIVEPKTRDPNLYYKLGLDMDSPTSCAVEILLGNTAGKITNKLILGKRNSWQVDLSYGESIYMRTHTNDAWLVKVNLPQKIEEFTEWFTNPLHGFNEAIKVTIIEPSSVLELVKEKNDFILHNLAQDHKIKSPQLINQIAQTALNLRFTDVILRPGNQLPVELEINIYEPNDKKNVLKVMKFNNDPYVAINELENKENYAKYLFKIQPEDLALLQYNYGSLVDKVKK